MVRDSAYATLTAEDRALGHRLAAEWLERGERPDAGAVAEHFELAGRRRPLEFEVESAADGSLAGRAVIVQSDWGMKPYSALFGTLKVVDEVEVAVEARPHGA